VDAKNFVDKKRRPIQIGFPINDPDEKKIQDCDSELRKSGYA